MILAHIAYALSANPVVNIVIWLILAGAVCWFIFNYLPLPQVVRVGLAILIAVLLVLSLFGCSTTTGNSETNIRNAGLNDAGQAAINSAIPILGSVATSVLLSTVQAEASGGKVDVEQSAAQGLWTSSNVALVSSGVKNTVLAFSGGEATQTAIEAQKAADAALANGKSPAAVTNAVATVISTGAGAPPAK